MNFFVFILLVLLLMIGIPLFRGWLYLRRIKRRVNDVFGDSSSEQRQGRQRRYQYEEDDDGKMYDRTDGEYAEFEEIRGTTIEETITDADGSRTVIEEQITDAEYEEIP